jgi:magnesium chelatase subunit D
VILHPDDLLKRLRLRHPGRLLLLVTDISGSMGTKLMALAKRTALTLLERAYVQRDQVAMLAFRDRRAELIFPPTNQAELVQRAMADLPCGGTTPLSRALELAHRTLSAALNRDPCLHASMLLISDGKANVGIRSGYKTMLSEIEILSSELVGQPRLKVLFVDTTERGKNDYPARWLAERLGAERFVLHRMAESGKDPALEIARALG